MRNIVTSNTTNDPRIQAALQNSDAYISILATLPDKKLAEKLDVIHLQSKTAVEKRADATVELLEIRRSQVIDARTFKAENNIPDAPDELAMMMEEIEHVEVKSNRRTRILEKSEDSKIFEPEMNDDTGPEHDSGEQLSLFWKKVSHRFRWLRHRSSQQSNFRCLSGTPRRTKTAIGRKL